MRRKRNIESSIGMDEDIAKLTDFEVRVYLFGLAHTDNYARFVGDAEKFKKLVDPYSPHPVEDYEKALQKIAETKLITLYNVAGKKYIQYKKESFDRINAFWIKRRGVPEYPAENEEQIFDLDVFMFQQWGDVWQRTAYAVKTKIVELSLKYEREKFQKAVEYSAERDARNFVYLKAILEGREKEVNHKGFLQRMRDKE